jgi:hypothetical protein
MNAGLEGIRHDEGVPGAVVVPIYQTSADAQEALGKHKGCEYARTGDPSAPPSSAPSPRSSPAAAVSSSPRGSRR